MPRLALVRSHRTVRSGTWLQHRAAQRIQPPTSGLCPSHEIMVGQKAIWPARISYLDASMPAMSHSPQQVTSVGPGLKFVCILCPIFLHPSMSPTFHPDRLTLSRPTMAAALQKHGAFRLGIESTQGASSACYLDLLAVPCHCNDASVTSSVNVHGYRCPARRDSTGRHDPSITQPLRKSEPKESWATRD
jgi:hypothetical protein